ncbi:MAG: WecB/TagA/CpsF family glycosyltransferase [Peptococcaceae bacterium]|jgi:N-acetylglucosaminyldiphosphoundecaprenol N-acetyl-beta-D-mannosaminyltransferase|nr:WecB/TagA/CpsF family glycosyltransferase [Peptococcaceae bacterium]
MKIQVLHIQVDQVDMAESIQRISAAIASADTLRVVTANPEMIYAAEQDASLQEVLNSAGLVVPDGTGVVWAARRLGYPLKERVTGIDLLQRLWPLAHAGKWRIFVLGNRPGVAEQAVAKLCTVYPDIIWQVRHGYFEPMEERQIIQQIQSFNADLLLAGLGSPRQELWLARQPGLARVSIGVGGSFDVLAGLVPRAPAWMRRCRLEWLYRLWLEPQRGKRQTALPKFVLAVNRQRKQQQKP